MPDPLDTEFWLKESETLYEILFPIFRLSAVNSARASFVEISGIADIGVSWDVFNTMAVQWAQQHTAQVVAQITDTSMSGFLMHFDEWVQSGEPLPWLIEKLEPFYGEVRAGMVAVTEVTRAYALGNLSVWKNTGMVVGFNVQTAEDDLVCPICTGEEASNPHGLDYEPPPYHVNCRCWLQPVLEDH